jgi:molecular chaperone GrpE
MEQEKQKTEQAQDESTSQTAQPRETAAPQATGAAENSGDNNGEEGDTFDITEEHLRDLEAKAAQADEFRDRLLRVSADFDNYKKRAAREKQDAIRYANESLLQKLLPVLDNFEMALAAVNAAGENNSSNNSLQTGVQMILGQLKTVLADSGLEEIDSQGKPFDPNIHEAVSQKETSDMPEGTVVQQLRRGYRMKDRLIRPASVIVAKKPSAQS